MQENLIDVAFKFMHCNESDKFKNKRLGIISIVIYNEKLESWYSILDLLRNASKLWFWKGINM